MMGHLVTAATTLLASSTLAPTSCFSLSPSSGRALLCPILRFIWKVGKFLGYLIIIPNNCIGKIDNRLDWSIFLHTLLINDFRQFCFSDNFHIRNHESIPENFIGYISRSHLLQSKHLYFCIALDNQHCLDKCLRLFRYKLTLSRMHFMTLNVN